MLEHWALIESDLQERGVDVGDDRLMRERSWRWLRTRILGLLDTPASVDVTGRLRFATRLQEALAPAAPDVAQREEG